LAHDAHHGPGEEEDDTSFAEELEREVVDVAVLKLKVLSDVLDEMRHEFLQGGRKSPNIYQNCIKDLFIANRIGL
jgi:hypothetical protein